jgi:hypothetical protein
LSGGRKIVLHIGLHKTGTTTIQRVLHENREFVLRQEGVLYPSLAANLSNALGTIFRDNPRNQMANKVAGFTSEKIAAHRKKYLSSLDAEISSGRWDTLVLSGEGVSHFTEAELAKLRAWGERYSSEWTVLVCVRHAIDWARSVVQERQKQGDTLEQLYERPPTPKYRLKISRAISVFGRQSVRLFDFESAVEGEGGIVGAFAREAGLGATTGEFLASRAQRYNESLSMEAALILDALNRQHPLFVGDARGPHRAGPGRELAYLRRIKGRGFEVPEAVKERIRSQSREDVLWLNETFGLELYRDVRDSAPQAHSRHEEPVQALSDPAVEGIAEVFGELVATTTFYRLLEQGRVASRRGNLERAERALREAARLDPDAPQPKRLLREATAKQPGESTGVPARRLKP